MSTEGTVTSFWVGHGMTRSLSQLAVGNTDSAPQRKPKRCLPYAVRILRLANMRTNGFERKRCTSRYYRLATCLHHANVRTLNSSSQEYKG
ncbi:hypothetical protein RRG08_041909 [Elysia crispata]|uniref:Uncharacterized protein n=1 Tax=Elysia crispata TaxID=231223 RepID=A0AAE1CNW8_9GAST|nr:hypothetical protein RRG08_041909 [Elysia crispata]